MKPALERYIGGMLAAATIAALVWGAWSLVSYSNQREAERDVRRAEAARAEIGATCMEWRRASANTRYLDGPWQARSCQHYETTATDADRERATALYQHHLDEATEDWKLAAELDAKKAAAADAKRLAEDARIDALSARSVVPTPAKRVDPVPTRD